MGRQVFVEFAVAKHACPDGDWQPFIHKRTLENGDAHIWGVSVWPTTSSGDCWESSVGGPILWRSGEQFVAEKEDRGETVVIRLVKIT